MMISQKCFQKSDETYQTLIIFVYILFFLLISGCEKTKLIPITSKSLNEKISKFNGKKAVLVNIWALWCIPCFEEFPMIVELANEIKDLEVIFVSADFDDDLHDVLKFLNSYNIGPVSYIKKQKDESFIEGLHPSWSGSLPFTIVYGKSSGNIVDYWEGIESELRFSKAISRALIN